MKRFSLANIRECLKEARVNWFAYLVILIGTCGYMETVFFATDSAMKHAVEASRLEQIGTAWVLIGALWTALGPHLNVVDRRALETMASQGTLDAKEIVRMFKAASNFALSGAIMILAGSAALFYKMLFY